jgi:hypothetical protein
MDKTGTAASVSLQQPYLRVVGLQEESDAHKDESFRWVVGGCVEGRPSAVGGWAVG